MRITCVGLLTAAAALTACGSWTAARSAPATDARVVAVIDTSRDEQGAARLQRLEVVTADGRRHRVLWDGAGRPLHANTLVVPGDSVLMVRSGDPESPAGAFVVRDIVRVQALWWIPLVLLAVLAGVARRQGIAAFATLAGGLAAFVLIAIPAVERGIDPLAAIVPVALALAVVSVFVVHGLGRKSVAALAGTAAGLGLVAVMAGLALPAARLSGAGARESVELAQAGADATHLLLAGMLVGALGALIDMSIGQSSTVFELARIDARLRGLSLYLSALRVGNDHVGALVNTLAFVYVGGALPVLVLQASRGGALAFALNDEGFVASLLALGVGSIALVLVVPITTLAAVMLVPAPAERPRPRRRRA